MSSPPVSNASHGSQHSPPALRQKLRPVRGIGASWQVRFATKRLAQGVFVLLGAVTISFILIHLTGNPALVLAGGSVSMERVHQLSAQLGFDRPILVQYFSYLGDLLRGDFGVSFRYNVPVIEPVMRALPNTLVLVFGALALACIVALPVAVQSVLRRDTVLDTVVRRVLIIGQGTPEFWLGLMLVLLFSVHFGLLPAIGFGGPASLILPVVTLSIPPMSMFTRLLRNSMLDFAQSDLYVALRARGISASRVIWSHALRNSIPSFLTFFGLELGWLVGGTIFTEVIFVWPGIGNLLLSAVKARDLQLLQCLIVVIACGYIIINILVDLAILVIDPRARANQ